ncbi:MAG: pseudouridine synthase [Flavobacteriales bacterium]|nr:pseudouridine synthase [Flavobacteriales bacterium]
MKKEITANRNKTDFIRLNKYISNSGICSRREADKFIEAGIVSVNGKVITQMGFKVNRSDIIKFNDSIIKNQKLKYLLLNKPKNYTSSFKDAYKKNSVISLIKGKCKENLFSIGKLDKKSTGLLLFSNDNELNKKLTKKSLRIKSIYQATLNRNLVDVDLKKIKEKKWNELGIKINEISYSNLKDKKEIGLEIIGPTKNVVEKIFDKFNYQTTKVDRVYYAGLTKKNLARKESRFLTEEEVSILKRL